MNNQRLKYDIAFYGMVGIILIVVGTWIWNTFKEEPVDSGWSPWVFSEPLKEPPEFPPGPIMIFRNISVDTLYVKSIIIPNEIGLVIDSANNEHYWIEGKRYNWKQ